MRDHESGKEEDGDPPFLRLALASWRATEKLRPEPSGVERHFSVLSQLRLALFGQARHRD